MLRSLVSVPLLAVLASFTWLGVQTSLGQPRQGFDSEPTPAGGTTATAHPLSDADVAKASATIDALITADLTAHQQTANPLSDDPTFLRRAYLTIIGRIPTGAEAQAWLASKDANKRDALIDNLQKQPGRIAHDFTWWADLLRVSTKLGDRYPGNAYVDWVKESLRQNKPYDQMVRELLTAKGPALARGNGATGYYLRDAGMPLDNLANTAQIFLGTRIQCAQCHDHPFDKWKRLDFFHLAAYTNDLKIDREGEVFRAMRKKMKREDLPQSVQYAIRLIGNSVMISITPPKQGTIALPADYQYKNAKPGDTVKAQPLYGTAMPLAAGISPTETLASWLTGSESPRFTTVIANRMWKRAFGLGVIEPLDNFTDTTVAANAPLMDFLGKLMISVDYDLMRFQKILLSTQAWQRQATTADPVAGEPYRFQGPVLRRMSPEQMWDSLMTLGVPDVDKRPGESAERLYKFYEDTKGMDGNQLFAVAEKIGAARDAVRDLNKRASELRDILQTSPDKNSDQVRRARAELHDIEGKRNEISDQIEISRLVSNRATGPFGQFVRASELPQPADPAHLLRTFGQSDRETIESASTAATTPQALTMLNGFIDRELLKEKTQLYRNMLQPPDIGGKVDVLFLSILSRFPTAGEREQGKTEIATTLATERKRGDHDASANVGQDSTKIALHDLAWVLVNSNEFLFIR